jgi:DNA-directed RNA polymerase subunit RPC12/RpoP
MKIDVNKLKWNRESDACCPNCGSDNYISTEGIYYICVSCGHQFEPQD